MDKRGAILDHLCALIEELHQLREQEGRKDDRSLTAAQVHLIQAIFILGERRGT